MLIKVKSAATVLEVWYVGAEVANDGGFVIRLCCGFWVGDAIQLYVPSHAPAGRRHDNNNGLAGFEVRPNPFSLGCNEKVDTYNAVEVEASTEAGAVKASDQELSDSVFTTADLNNVNHVWVPCARPFWRETLPWTRNVRHDPGRQQVAQKETGDVRELGKKHFVKHELAFCGSVGEVDDVRQVNAGGIVAAIRSDLFTVISFAFGLNHSGGFVQCILLLLSYSGFGWI